MFSPSGVEDIASQAAAQELSAELNLLEEFIPRVTSVSGLIWSCLPMRRGLRDNFLTFGIKGGFIFTPVDQCDCSSDPWRSPTLWVVYICSVMLTANWNWRRRVISS